MVRDEDILIDWCVLSRIVQTAGQSFEAEDLECFNLVFLIRKISDIGLCFFKVFVCSYLQDEVCFRWFK